VEFHGRRVAPGFVDNHIHFIGGGIDLDGVQLREAMTPEEFTRRVAEYAQRRPGRWFTGGPRGASLPPKARRSPPAPDGASPCAGRP
jgi:predicted amidohydrolase YtcJ